MKVKHYIVAWWRLSRVPFLSVGILPLILGFILAWRWGYKGPLGLYALSTAAVILIMWMTYYVGEWNDLEGDRINQHFNHFSGGSRRLFLLGFHFFWDMDVWRGRFSSVPISIFNTGLILEPFS
jgi:hypothetical protein